MRQDIKINKQRRKPSTKGVRERKIAGREG